MDEEPTIVIPASEPDYDGIQFLVEPTVDNIRKGFGDLPGVITEIELLGEGGIGSVYRVTRNNVTRAFKFFYPKAYSEKKHFDENLGRFRDERDINNIFYRDGDDHVEFFPRIYGGGTHNGLEYFEMDYLKGGNLGEFTENHFEEDYFVDRLLKAIIQSASALAYSHKLGWTHSDVKSENIFLEDEGSAGTKLLDFGLAHGYLIERDGSGSIHGSPMWISPDQVRFYTGKIDDIPPSADVYSLNLVFDSCFRGGPIRDFKVNKINPKDNTIIRVSKNTSEARNQVLHLAKEPEELPDFEYFKNNPEFIPVIQWGREFDSSLLPSMKQYEYALRGAAIRAGWDSERIDKWTPNVEEQNVASFIDAADSLRSTNEQPYLDEVREDILLAVAEHDHPTAPGKLVSIPSKICPERLDELRNKDIDRRAAKKRAELEEILAEKHKSR